MNDRTPDTRWFSEEVHPHDAALKAHLRGAFPSVRDVDDVVQECYLRIWKTHTAQPVRSVRGLLFKIARHLALDLIRRERRSPIDRVSDLAALDVLVDGPDAGESAGTREKIARLADAIAALPERRREIVILRKLHRLSQKEVADRLGLSERTVENQLFRGVRQCEAFLRGQGINSLYGDE